METKLGKIVLEKNKPNPIVIIAKEGRLRGLKLIKDHSLCSYDDITSHYVLSNDDIIKSSDYKGKKLENNIVDCGIARTIYNLEIREIGFLTDDAYYKLIKEYNNYQVSLGGRNSSYLMVRDEVHKQLIKNISKNTMGV